MRMDALLRSALLSVFALGWLMIVPGRSGAG